MKTTLSFILCLLLTVTVHAQSNQSTNPTPADQQRAKSYKADQKMRAKNKSTKGTKETTINTKDPGTDAVRNSTTGGRNKPGQKTPSSSKDTSAVRDGKDVKILPQSKKRPNTSGTEKKRSPGSNAPSTSK